MEPLAIFLSISLCGEVALGDTNFYLKPKYTAEGEFLLDYLKYNDVLEEEQELLPRKLHTAFKIITGNNFNITKVLDKIIF